MSQRVKPLEEKHLREWATAQNLILDNRDFDTRWQDQGSLGEAENNVYFDEPSQRWFKRNNLSYHSSYLEFFYRMALHNELFPEAPLALEGFVETADGLQPVMSQHNVRSQRGATRDEVVILMRKLGYENIRNTDDYYNEETGIQVEDLHNENVLMGEDGQIYVIDPVIYLDDGGKHHRLSSGEPLSFAA